MPGPVLTIAAAATCPHGGKVTIAGCPFQIPIGTGTKPQPCVKVQYTVPATRVQVLGSPVVLSTSVGLCQSAEQIPQGAPIVSAVQPRVIAT